MNANPISNEDRFLNLSKRLSFLLRHAPSQYLSDAFLQNYYQGIKTPEQIKAIFEANKNKVRVFHGGYLRLDMLMQMPQLKNYGKRDVGKQKSGGKRESQFRKRKKI